MAFVDAKPEDDHASFVLSLVKDSQKELDRVALAHQEALLNSMGAGANEFPVTPENPYGDPFGLVRAYFEERAVSDIISPFSAEQTSAITTKLAAPLIGQRETLYVEANGGADQVRKAKIRERLWERAIRSAYTQWSMEVWKVTRDVVVKSRGFMEVCHLNLEEYRKVYSYNPAEMLKKLVMSGFMKLLGQEGAGTVRIGSMKKVTLWDGPILRARPFGTVYRDPSDTALTDLSRWVAVNDCMSKEELIAAAEAEFPRGSKIPFKAEMLDELKPVASNAGIKTIEQAQREVIEKRPPADKYSPFDVLKWRGIDPEEDQAKRWVYWVVNGKCIGAKQFEGSGPWNNIVELVWDPMTDFATSMSPIMLVRRLQEMLSLLLSNGIDASTWEAHPGGIVNEMVINDISEIREMRPSEFVKKMGDGQAVERVQLGANSMQTLQHYATVGEVGRSATGGVASMVGVAPPGATTATEFSGISSGAMGRLDIQQEINADLATKRLFNLVIACWRDSLQDDATLQELIGDDGTLGDVTLEDLDGDMECIPMAARYQMIRQQELAAIKSLIMDSRLDPYLAAKLKKEELYDDYVYAAAGGPRGWRWAKTSKEMQSEGLDPATLEQLQVQNAAQSGGQGGGQPSQAALPSAQPSQILPGGTGV